MRGTREKPTVLKYGARGVEVALHSYTSPGPNVVFWSPQRYHPDGSPGGGFNSFVLVDDPERGYFRLGDKDYDTDADRRVALVSINGIGEIRWTINGRHMIRDAEGSIEHFGLRLWEKEEGR